MGWFEMRRYDGSHLKPVIDSTYKQTMNRFIVYKVLPFIKLNLKISPSSQVLTLKTFFTKTSYFRHTTMRKVLKRNFEDRETSYVGLPQYLTVIKKVYDEHHLKLRSKESQMTRLFLRVHLGHLVHLGFA